MTRIVLQLSLVLLLFAGNVVLIHRVYDLAHLTIDAPSPEQAWRPDTGPDDTPRIELAPLSAFAQTTTRPLFFDTRRQPIIAVAVPKASPVQPKRIAAPASQFRLFGIVHYGEERRALIEGPSVLLDWYSEGAKLQLWTLTRIESTSVLLSFEDQSGELRLFPSGEQN